MTAILHLLRLDQCFALQQQNIGSDGSSLLVDRQSEKHTEAGAGLCTVDRELLCLELRQMEAGVELLLSESREVEARAAVKLRSEQAVSSRREAETRELLRDAKEKLAEQELMLRALAEKAMAAETELEELRLDYTYVANEVNVLHGKLNLQSAVAQPGPPRLVVTRGFVAQAGLNAAGSNDDVQTLHMLGATEPGRSAEHRQPAHQGLSRCEEGPVVDLVPVLAPPSSGPSSVPLSAVEILSASSSVSATATSPSALRRVHETDVNENYASSGQLGQWGTPPAALEPPRSPEPSSPQSSACLQPVPTPFKKKNRLMRTPDARAPLRPENSR